MEGILKAQKPAVLKNAERFAEADTLQIFGAFDDPSNFLVLIDGLPVGFVKSVRTKKKPQKSTITLEFSDGQRSVKTQRRRSTLEIKYEKSPPQKGDEVC